ncbi:MAG: ATP-binding protein, partial [Bdellovibrionia bacterium]
MKLELAPEVPKWVRGDPGRLGQVLLNLLENAAKFMEKGGIILRISLESPPSLSRFQIRFQIIDTGIGIQE